MPEAPSYAIVGRGRWAPRIRGILAAENRRAVEIYECRQAAAETDSAYRSRLAEQMQAAGAQIAWLCVLPGPHVATMMEAALDAGLHVIAEKPWHGSDAVTDSLISRAKSLRRILAVHYEYCFLTEVERWRKDFLARSGLSFSGRFFLNRPNHTGMAALDNVGSHLLAIRAFAVPQAAVHEIQCGYERADERSVWLEKDGARVAFIDLLKSTEPIIQRFIAKMEASLDKAEFPIDLAFALRVAHELDAIR